MCVDWWAVWCLGLAPLLAVGLIEWIERA